MGIFDKRIAFKPFEYPDVIKFADAMANSFWTHREWSFRQDLHDFKTQLSPAEQRMIRRTTLAVAQIEVSVKTFWGDIYTVFPKPEFNILGTTFAESECRHSMAYSKMIEVLGLNEQFEEILEVECIKGRIDYLSKYLKNARSKDKKKYVMTLSLFSMFIENVSLFSQFYIFKKFNKERKILRDMDNVTQATQREEVLHYEAGAFLINEVKKEKPEWFTEKFYKKMRRAAKKAYKAELKILDWIFEDVETDVISKQEVISFVESRFNDSLRALGCEELFDVDEEQKALSFWYDVELEGEMHVDFFDKKSSNYARHNKAFTLDAFANFDQKRVFVR